MLRLFQQGIRCVRKQHCILRVSIEADSATTAALLLNDYRAAMTEPKYLAHMGGYFGKDGNDDVLVLQKGSWVMGVVGLAEKDADIVARGSAAWLD